MWRKRRIEWRRRRSMRKGKSFGKQNPARE